MVSYTVIKQSNARIRSTLPPSPTALFVGATSGIGRECMRAFVSYIQSPILYVVARSKSTGDREIEGLKELNDKGTYHFVEGDFTLLSSVEKVAQTVIEAMKEKGLDYVSLSPGFLDFSGRKGMANIGAHAVPPTVADEGAPTQRREKDSTLFSLSDTTHVLASSISSSPPSPQIKDPSTSCSFSQPVRRARLSKRTCFSRIQTTTVSSMSTTTAVPSPVWPLST